MKILSKKTVAVICITVIVLAVCSVFIYYALKDFSPVSDTVSELIIESEEEPEAADRVIRDDPVSTVEGIYGYKGSFDPKKTLTAHLDVSTGENVLDDQQILNWEKPVIQDSGDSVVIIRNSYIRGETTEETLPLAGAPGSLLIAGSMRTTLVMQGSQGFYINSTIASRNWAVLSTDAATPAREEGDLDPGVYAYGCEAIAMDGGYGSYSDIFCSVYAYGSHLQGAEIGIISGSYGKVVLGSIKDGENNYRLQSVLTDDDKDKRPDKELKTVVEGGRNAIMIHSLNLPSYWHNPGYSTEELPFRSAEIYAHNSILKTDLSLDREIKYDDQQLAYIEHTKGSVILIKSTNVEMQLDSCELTPDENGTGYLIQTVYNNDTLYMIPVPDGETYPGIHIIMRNMETTGDISHEDYQRDMYLELENTQYTGSMAQHGFEEWKEAAENEGFEDYCQDESYETAHGLHVSLTDNAVWNVTGESILTDLKYEEGCSVNGLIYLNGVLMTGSERSYHGEITVKPE